ncbi:glycoside hydrolase family 76 protein [Arthrobacter sp. TMN-50]
MLTSGEELQLRAAGLRAEAAAESVRSRFGYRLFGLPGTHLGAVRCPRGRPDPAWHYWWQAHYLDALVDAALRESERREVGHPVSALTARRLLRGILLRNGLRWRNSYYDDMAWLALAVDRLPLIGQDGGHAISALERALLSAHTPDAGGGLYWNTDRDFKNTPATGPAALFFARRGDPVRAQELVDWLGHRLRDQQTGLYQDGIRLTAGGELLVPTVYTYNQGPVLGALLELGGDANLAAAADLIIAVGKHLALDGVLITHGGGDGGLFTGILARYLSLAALDPSLPVTVRRTAAALVRTTATSLWSGRTEVPASVDRGRRRRPGTAVLAFPTRTGDDALAGGAELSTQLQAWMILEAAYRVIAGETGEGETPG